MSNGLYPDQGRSGSKPLATKHYWYFQVVFSVDGDSLVEKQKGDGFECTHVRTGSGNKLNMVIIILILMHSVPKMRH